MPNINTTSITPQERFAQTTVSYEKRDIMALPFYEGVEHKARIRGIMTMAILIGIIVGALAGLIFGFRDPIIDFLKSSPIYTAITGGESEEAPPPADEEMNVSLAASVDQSYVNRVIVNEGKSSKTVVYNGQPQKIEWGVADADVSDLDNLPVGVTFFYTENGATSGAATQIVTDSDWPTNAGTYIVTATITLNGEMTDEEFLVVLTIKKATVPYPGIVIANKENKVFDNTAKALTIENQLPLDLDTTPEFKIELDQVNSQGVHTGYKTVEEVKNAGNYRITLTVPGNRNYETAVYAPVDYTISKARVPEISNAAFSDASYVYDGTAKTIKIDCSKLPDTFPADLKAEMESGKVISYTVTGGTAVNVGHYKVSAVIDSYNYNYRKFDASLEITKADLTNYFTFGNANTTYTGKAVSRELLEILKKQNCPSFHHEGIIIDYQYFKGTNTTEANKINAADIVNAGTYTVIATFTTGSNFNEIEPMKVTITVNKADIDVSGIRVNKKTETYTGSRISLSAKDVVGVPDGIEVDLKNAYAIDADTHEVPIILSSPNHNPVEIFGKIVIRKAEFDSGITALAIQSIPKDGKPHLPAYKGTLPEGTEINFYVGAKSIEGVDKLGTYDVRIVVSDKNHEHVIPVKLTIAFNPLTILMGIIIALPISILIAIGVWISYRLTEKKYAVHFYKVTRLLNRARGGARGGIICQSCSWIFDMHDEFEIRDFPWFVRPRFGRLYLTHSTLEFYDSNYIQNYKNVILQLRDISAVEIRGILRGKLIVFTTNGRHEFFVEPNTAYLWRRDIIHFRNLAHHHPVENYMVDNNYPFKYEVFTDGDWPPETRADVKKIKDMNK